MHIQYDMASILYAMVCYGRQTNIVYNATTTKTLLFLYIVYINIGNWFLNLKERSTFENQFLLFYKVYTLMYLL